MISKSITKANSLYKLNVSVIKEGDRFIAYSPALDLSTSGKSLEEATLIFFEELDSNGTTSEVLSDSWLETKRT